MIFWDSWKRGSVRVRGGMWFTLSPTLRTPFSGARKKSTRTSVEEFISETLERVTFWRPWKRDSAWVGEGEVGYIPPLLTPNPFCRCPQKITCPNIEQFKSGTLQRWLSGLPPSPPHTHLRQFPYPGSSKNIRRPNVMYVKLVGLKKHSKMVREPPFFARFEFRVKK